MPSPIKTQHWGKAHQQDDETLGEYIARVFTVGHPVITECEDYALTALRNHA